MTHLAVLNIVLLKFGSLKCSLLVHICICYVYKRHIFFLKKFQEKTLKMKLGKNLLMSLIWVRLRNFDLQARIYLLLSNWLNWFIVLQLAVQRWFETCCKLKAHLNETLHPLNDIEWNLFACELSRVPHSFGWKMKFITNNDRELLAVT